VYRLYSSAKLYPHSLALHPEFKERCRHLYVRQSCPRVELVVAADGPARVMEEENTKLPGNVQFLPFDQPVARAVAWNRAIRDAFSGLLIFVEPGDRFTLRALAALVEASRKSGDAALIRAARG
jgi:hypothetical protein